MGTESINAVSLTGSAEEHTDELSTLWAERRCAVRAPHYDFDQLADLDEQIAAHLDALRLAGPAFAGPALAAGWDDDFEHTHFAPAVLAIEASEGGLQGFVQRAKVRRGLISALGWVRPAVFDAAMASLSRHRSDASAALAVAAYRVQRRDLNSYDTMLEHEARHVRVETYRAVGELGRCEMLHRLQEQLGRDRSRSTRLAAATAALLLGDRSLAPRELLDAMYQARLSNYVVRLCLLALPVEHGHELLGRMAPGLHPDRLRIIGSGHVGDAKYAPWLIDQMTNPALARIAAEAFVHITGADFNLDQLEAMPPEDFEDGPSDDPDDDDVELPEDIALPWPDVERIKAWWMEHRSEFTPGQKLFLGKPITPEHCVHVLKTGFQRQRVIAAHYRTLIQPGTVLFPTSAPAWRQQKLLASM
jgi:uncharacterized protein (TIGR02270 family)